MHIFDYAITITRNDCVIVIVTITNLWFLVFHQGLLIFRTWYTFDWNVQFSFLKKSYMIPKRYWKKCVLSMNSEFWIALSVLDDTWHSFLQYSLNQAWARLFIGQSVLVWQCLLIRLQTFSKSTKMIIDIFLFNSIGGIVWNSK